MTTELTNFAMKVHNLVFGTDYNDPEIVSSMDLDSITDKMKKDHDDWIEEITERDGLRLELGEIMDKFNIDRNRQIDHVFEEELEKARELRREVRHLKQDLQEAQDIVFRLTDEIHDLELNLRD